MSDSQRETFKTLVRLGKLQAALTFETRIKAGM